MSQSRFTTRQMATAGIIAAVYAALTLLLPIPQYGGIQFRVAEAMTVLPFFPGGDSRPGSGVLPGKPAGFPFVLDWVFGTGHPAGGAVDVPAEESLSGAGAAGGLQRCHCGRGDCLVFRAGRCRLLAGLRSELCDGGPGRPVYASCWVCRCCTGCPRTRRCAAGR